MFTSKALYSNEGRLTFNFQCLGKEEQKWFGSVSDDVDTDLLRMLASKSLHVNKAEKGKKGWSKHSNGAISPAALHPDFR